MDSGMPSAIHQGLLFLLKVNPDLVFELASRFDPELGGEACEYRPDSNELPDPADSERVLHADWVVAAVYERDAAQQQIAGLAVEVQTSHDELKFYSWLSYAAGTRRHFSCRGWTLVFAPDEDVRRRAQNMFVDEQRAAPWFVTPELLPPIISREEAMKDIDRAVLTAMFHLCSESGVACIQAALEALQTVAHPYRKVYVDLMRASLTEEQMASIPERLFDIDENAPLGPMELRSAYYVRGRREGRAEGRVQGLSEGVIQLIAKQIELKFGSLDVEALRRLQAASTSELERIGQELMVAETLDEVFAGPPST